MSKCEVEVYRLWADGHWDKVPIQIPAEPWEDEIIKSRAVSKAWQMLANQKEKPLQIGLYMISIHNFNSIRQCNHEMYKLSIINSNKQVSHVMCECGYSWWSKDGYVNLLPRARVSQAVKGF